MVGIVLVSHSRALAEAVLEMMKAMTGTEVPVALAAGTGEGHRELGTDAVEISEAVRSVRGDDGVLVLMDIGSAVLSSEMALELLEEPLRKDARLCPCPFVEGAVAAGVAAKIGSSLDEVYREAVNALAQKKENIQGEEPAADNGPTAPPIIAPAEGSQSLEVKIPIPGGLHARPVVNLIAEGAKYKSDITIKNGTTGKGPVSLRSMTAVISLELLYGQDAELTASGPDAPLALAGLRTAIEGGLGDRLDVPAAAAPSTDIGAAPQAGSFKPVGVSEGIAIGPVFYPGNAAIPVPDNTVTDTGAEIERLRNAIADACRELADKASRLAAEGNQLQATLMTAHSAMAADPELSSRAENAITNGHLNAAYAWNKTLKEKQEEFRGLADENLRLRAADLQDVAAIVLSKLGVVGEDSLRPDRPSVLVVEELTPDQAVRLDKDAVLGVICLKNGPTSHSSILLRSRGIPAVVQAGSSGVALTDLPGSTILALDGSTGEIWVDPDPATTDKIHAAQAEYTRRSEENIKAGKSEALTTDNVRIGIYANIGRPGDSVSALDNGADGVGLLRTEFMFLDRASAPTEDEQVSLLRDMLAPIGDKDIVVRTLDAGGDKELGYLNMPHELNPQLGVRAIRLCLLRPDIFLDQLRAILRVAGEFPGLRVMFPMISMPGQLSEAKDYLKQAHEQLEEQGVPHRWPVSTGMMMEVPAAAIMAAEYMDQVDFVSISTNDLTQYTLAAERDNPYMQRFTTAGLDPAVVKLIANICREAARHDVEVAVCGETASDPVSAAVLVGLGVSVLSMSPPGIPAIKAWVRGQSLAALRQAQETSSGI